MLLRTRLLPPGFVEPCLPTPAERPPSGPGWLHEIKLDGFRLMARRDAAGVRLLTRNGLDWSSRYPGIASAVGKLRCRSCLLAGEVGFFFGPPSRSTGKSWPHFRPSAVDFCCSRLAIGAASERARALAMPAGTRAQALQTRL